MTEVIVVGAGPAGAATAIHLAAAGVDTLLLDKAHFPREKVCGDGLTPRAVRELAYLGLDTAGWHRTIGLRIYAGRDYPYLLRWPDSADFPHHALVRRRADFDQALVDRAVEQGVRFEAGVQVVAPTTSPGGRVNGVLTKDGRRYEAPLVVAADGNSGRLAIAAGRLANPRRPMGVAVRAYYRSPRANEDWLESWLELWDGPPGRSNLLPGYGWVFPEGDGSCNVGLGIVSTSPAFGRTDYRALLRRWLDHTPKEWGFRDTNRLGEIRSAALPLGFNRGPVYQSGLMLAGDAGGFISPFNGEGISYALESGRYAAAHIAQAKVRGFGSRGAELALQAYGQTLRDQWGRHFAMGNLFVRLIGDPRVMHLCSHYLLPLPGMPQFVHRTLANLVDDHPQDAYDRAVHFLRRLMPPAV